jgi:DNA processing protein
MLIKHNMANLLDSAEDVATALRWTRETSDTPQAVQGHLFEDFSEEEKTVVDILQQHDEAGVDQLSYASGIAHSVLASLLLNLEFRGVVRSLPGKRYVLC